MIGDTHRGVSEAPRAHSEARRGGIAQTYVRASQRLVGPTPEARRAESLRLTWGRLRGS